jgi:hypothetical protein
MCCRASKTTWERCHGLWPGKTNITPTTSNFEKKKYVIHKKRANPVRKNFSLVPISPSKTFLWPKSDDENYFTFSHSILIGINGVWTDDVENTRGAIKYKIRWQV